MAYVELVILGDNEKCRKVLALMGWETKEEQDELLEELSDECDDKHYLVHYENTIAKKPAISEYDDFMALYTIGSEEGNRWYPIELPGFRDMSGNCWVKEDVAEDAC